MIGLRNGARCAPYRALSPALKKTIEQLREHSPFLCVDRALEQELRLCLELVGKQYWGLYA